MLLVILQVVADTYLAPILIGLTLAFVTQAVASWMMNIATKQQVSGLVDDIVELQDLHPRQGNPGELTHDVKQFCNNPDCRPSTEDLHGLPK